MKTPLRYQITQYDCGATSMLNALMYLFERSEIAYEAVRMIEDVCVDKYWGSGDAGGGTSAQALVFLASWLNTYAERTGFSLSCKALDGAQVNLSDEGPIMQALKAGGVCVAGCCLGADHYVLLTGVATDGRIKVFDSYYDTWPLHELNGAEVVGVEVVEDQPFSHNRLIEPWVFEESAGTPYTFEAQTGRDAIIFERTKPSV